MVALQSAPLVSVAPPKVVHLLAIRLELTALLWRMLGQCYWQWGCCCLCFRFSQGERILHQGSRYLELAAHVGILAQGLWLPRRVEIGDVTPAPAPTLNLGLAALASLLGHGLVLWALGFWSLVPPETPPPPIPVTLLPPPPPPPPAAAVPPAPPPVAPPLPHPAPPPRRDPPPRPAPQALATAVPPASPLPAPPEPPPPPQFTPAATAAPTTPTPLSTPIPRLTPLLAVRPPAASPPSIPQATPQSTPRQSTTVQSTTAPSSPLSSPASPETLAKPIPGSNPPPPYPPAARQMQQQGQVMLRAKVNEQGSVVAVEVSQSSGFLALDRAALTTVQRWRFTPAQRNGIPIPSWVTVPIRFTLN